MSIIKLPKRAIEVVNVLKKKGKPMPPKELAEAVGIHTPHLHSVLRKLEVHGIVGKSPLTYGLINPDAEIAEADIHPGRKVGEPLSKKPPVASKAKKSPPKKTPEDEEIPESKKAKKPQPPKKSPAPKKKGKKLEEEIPASRMDPSDEEVREDAGLDEEMEARDLEAAEDEEDGVDPGFKFGGNDPDDSDSDGDEDWED